MLPSLMSFAPSSAARLVCRTSFSLLVLCSALGCSTSAVPPSTFSTQEPAPPQDDGDALPNMDQLEADQDFTLLTPDDRRAVILGELWLKHGERLRGASRVGSLAAFLRAAHTASTVLTSDTCSDPFNESCGTLRDVYARALREIVSEVRLGDWQAPDLAPSRYRLEIATDGVPVDLRLWNFEFSRSPQRPSTERRSGIGLDAAGCRTFVSTNGSQLPIDVCSPLTFVLSFASPPTSDRTLATLSVYDSFQREVVQIGGKEISLAADFGMTWTLLAQRARDMPRSRLLCMSSPGDDPATVIAVVDPRISDGQWESRYASLSVDGLIRNGYGFCLFPLRASTGNAKQSRDLVASLASLSTVDGSRPLLRDPAEVFFVPEGASAAQVVTGALAQLRRQGRARKALPNNTMQPDVRGVYMIPSPSDSADTNSATRAKLLHRATPLNAPVYPSLDTMASLDDEDHTRELHKALAENQIKEEEPAAETTRAETDEVVPLKLSPIY